MKVLPKVDNFKLRAWSKKPCQFFLWSMSLNIDSCRNLTHFRPFEQSKLEIEEENQLFST